jgi:hypothetical protein
MPTKYCRHIRVNGERCGSPALKNKIFCYFHVEFERRHRYGNPLYSTQPTVIHPMSLQDGSQREPLLAEFAPSSYHLDLPPLEDRHSIQVALSMIILALAEGHVDPTLAMQLFYGLQVASTNANKLNPIPKRALGKVSLTVIDENNGTLIAPEGDPEDPEETQDYERKGTATRYLEMLQAEDKEKDRLKAEAIALTGYPPNPVPYGPGDTK